MLTPLLHSSDRRPQALLTFQLFGLLGLGLIVAICLSCPTTALAQENESQKTAHNSSAKSGGGKSGEAKVSGEKSGGGAARGKYLVESVAMCGQCHTPRDSEGNPDRSQWLQGGSLPYMPAQPNSNWPVSAPRIGGNPPASDADMVKLLTTGIWITGERLRFPMPQFRLDKGDAEAVVAYLKAAPSKQ